MSKTSEEIKKIQHRIQKTPKCLVILSLKQFGDVLHTSLIVKHYRVVYPHRPIFWVISERYIDAFEYFNHAIKIGIRHDLNIVERATIGKWLKDHYETILPCVGVWGWPAGAADITTAFLLNAKIRPRSLKVDRKTCLPTGAEDKQWADRFIKEHNLQKFHTLEYNSYTLSKPPHNNLLEWKTPYA